MRSDTSHATRPTQFEPIPLPALVLHGIFSTILILVTLTIKQPKDAYPFLVGRFLNLQTLPDDVAKT